MPEEYCTPCDGVFEGSASIQTVESDTGVPTVAVSDLPAAPVRFGLHDGEKFPGGYGTTHLLQLDYWLLRLRSAELFQTNLYARGLIRRLVTNEINTGLSLECKPFEAILGLPSESLDDWTEEVEQRFELWGSTPAACDHQRGHSLGELQAIARRESLICGDVLVVLRFDARTRAPRVQLVSGEKVQSPLTDKPPRTGRRIVHGVELDRSDRQVAYWVRQDDGTSRRLAAEASGRRVAWLVYGCDRRMDEVRGQPFLALMLQSLKEIDRYRDSAMRKAVLNSFVAIYLQRDQPTAARNYVTGPAQRKVGAVAQESPQARKSQELMPGLILQDLEPGESPKAFPATGTDEKFGDFEKAMVSTLAWASETPPEILSLSFDRNYAASAASLNEFKLYLSKVRREFGQQFCAPIYREWLVSEALSQRIVQPGLLDAWRSEVDDPYAFAAWVRAEWPGQVKPTVDLWKLAKATEILLDRGLTTHQLVARELSGSKWSQNIKQQKLERQLAAEAGVPLGVQQVAEPPEGADEDEEEANAVVD